MSNLRKQFEQALTNIEVNGLKRKRAIQAHTEIRALLEQDKQLKDWGIQPLLIGSYGRGTGIYPGKDVDVLLRFIELDTGAEPGEVYNAVWRAIDREYGQYGKGGGRALQQARSIKVLFPESEPTSGGDFSVDSVPAVRNLGLWAIPTKNQNHWLRGKGRWVTTGAVCFGELSEKLNQSAISPKVGERHAYKPMVKLVRQIREAHLGDNRPGGLYLEFVTFNTWQSGLVAGNEWDSLLAQTLQLIAGRFLRAEVDPLLDPVLRTPIDPPISVSQVKHVAAIFGRQADAANRALDMTTADATEEWRRILGGNDRANPVFPKPSNSTGRVSGIVAANRAGVASEAGTNFRRNEAPRFG